MVGEGCFSCSCVVGATEERVLCGSCLYKADEAYTYTLKEFSVRQMTIAHTGNPFLAAALTLLLSRVTPWQLVKIHGGPTSAATTLLNLGYQFWTSRGFAIADVNYGGCWALHAGCLQVVCRVYGAGDFEC